MQPIRLVFKGSVDACAQWVGVAKKWARQTFEAGILHKTYQIDEAVKVTVRNLIPSHGWLGFSEVTIEAGVFNWYQFLTTTVSPYFVIDDGVKYYSGSGLFVKIPDPPSIKPLLPLKPIAVGSTKQEPNQNEGQQWGFIEEPSNSSEIKEVYRVLLKTDNGYIQGGVVPNLNWLTKPFYIKEEFSHYIINKELFSGSLSGGGIQFLGSKMLIGPSLTSLNEDYSGVVNNGIKLFPIETNDYVSQGFLHQAESIQFGLRLFVILVNANGSFQAVPVASPIEDNLIDQKYVKSATPTYPGWVFPFVNLKETEASAGQLPLTPLVEWSFNSTGSKAIAMLVERTEFAGTQKILDLNRNEVNVSPTDRVYEVDTGQPVKVNAQQAWLGSGESETLAIDRLGLVELEFQVSLTGSNLEDYQFSVNVLRNEPPNDDAIQRVRVAYAMPLQWTNGIVTDDVLSLCLELRETPEAARYRGAQDGVYGLEMPQYGRWSIRKGDTEVLTFPSHYLQLNDAPLPYCCLQDMALAEHYTTKLIDLDLASLSFIRKSEARIPHLTLTGGWDTLTKTTATRLDTFVFGEIKHSQITGDEEAQTKLAAYLNQNPSLNTVLPSLTTTLRARYYNYETQPLMLGPWWGEVLRLPIIQSFCEALYTQTGNSQVTDLYPLNIYPALDSLNEDNFITNFFEWITNFNEHNISYNAVGIYHPPYAWPVLSMLSDANSTFDSSAWMEPNIALNDVAWFLWRCVERARKNTMSVVLGDEYNRIRHAVAAFHSSDAGVYSSVEPWVLLDIGRSKTTSDHLVIKDYPIGQHWFIQCYRNLLVNDGFQQVMTHPNGHYTVFYKDEGYTGFLPEWEVGADDYPNLADSVIVHWHGNFNGSGTVPSFSATPVTPLLHDKISFWNGQLETSHVELHNQAFDRTESLSEYYPSSCFSSESTANKEPILIINGRRQPCNYWANPFFRAVLSGEANTIVKDNSFAVARARVAPLLG